MANSFGTFEPSDAMLAAMQARVGAKAAAARGAMLQMDDLTRQQPEPGPGPAGPAFKLHGGLRDTVPPEHRDLPPAAVRVAESGGVSFGIMEASRQYAPPSPGHEAGSQRGGVFTVDSASPKRCREPASEVREEQPAGSGGGRGASTRQPVGQIGRSAAQEGYGPQSAAEPSLGQRMRRQVPTGLADIDEDGEDRAGAGDSEGKMLDGYQPATSSRSARPSSGGRSSGSRMSRGDQASIHAAADEALSRALAQASAGMATDEGSCFEEGSQDHCLQPSISISKLPTAVTVAGVPVATTGDLVYLGGGLYAAAPVEKPVKKQSAPATRPRPRKSAIRSASAHILGPQTQAEHEPGSPHSRAQSEGQIGVGNLNWESRGPKSDRNSVAGSVGSAPSRVWRPSGVQKLPPAKLEPPAGFGGKASRLSPEDIGKMPGDHSEDRASSRRLQGKEGVMLFGANGILAHMRDPVEPRHQALPPAGPPQGIERRLEERKAAKQQRVNEILEEKALREATEAAISMQRRQNLAAVARNASAPDLSEEDMEKRKTRVACKMEILDFFQGYRKAVHKLTSAQQKVLQANLHGSVALPEADRWDALDSHSATSIQDRLKQVNDVCNRAFADPRDET